MTDPVTELSKQQPALLPTSLRERRDATRLDARFQREKKYTNVNSDYIVRVILIREIISRRREGLFEFARITRLLNEWFPFSPRSSIAIPFTHTNSRRPVAVKSIIS